MFSYETNFKIKTIKRENDNIEILSDHKTYKFDKLVLATHADQALSLINKPTVEEKKSPLSPTHSTIIHSIDCCK